MTIIDAPRGAFAIAGISMPRLDTRDWTKWHLEHPYTKKGWQSHITPEEYNAALKAGFQGWKDKTSAEFHKVIDKHQFGVKDSELHLAVHNEAGARAYAEATKSGLTAQQMKWASTNKGTALAKKAKASGDHMSHAEHLGTAHGWAQAAKEQKAIEKAQGTGAQVSASTPQHVGTPPPKVTTTHADPHVSSVASAHPVDTGVTGATPAKPATGQSVVSHKRLENSHGTHNKFYESAVIDNGDGTYTHHTAYGSMKPGAHVYTNTPKVYHSHAAAMGAHTKILTSKVYSHGYDPVATKGHKIAAVEAIKAAGGVPEPKDEQVIPTAPAQISAADLSALEDEYPHLSSAQITAVVGYTTQGYKSVNQKLRGSSHVPGGDWWGEGGEPMSEADTDAMIATLKSALHPVPQNLTVIRAINPAVFGLSENPLNWTADATQALAGKTITDKGFGSVGIATPDLNVPGGGMGQHPVTVTMVLPKGTPTIAAWPHADDAWADENELIVGPGLTFHVDTVEKGAGGDLHVTAHVVPTTATAEELTGPVEEAPVAAPAAHSPLPTTVGALTGLKKIDGPLGSNGGQWYELPDGGKILVKPGDSPDHIYNEVAVNSVYAVAGAKVKDTAAVQGSGGTPPQHVVGRSIDPIEAITPGNVTAADQAEARKHFGIDALTSNWDVFGLPTDPHGRNLFRDDKGGVYRLDNGGGGFYRAQGSPKGEAFKVGDWEKNAASGAEDKNDYRTLLTSDQGKLTYGNAKSSDQEIMDSLDAAADLDLKAVGDHMEANGVSTPFITKFLAVVGARQQHLRAQGFGKKGAPGYDAEGKPTAQTVADDVAEIAPDLTSGLLPHLDAQGGDTPHDIGFKTGQNMLKSGMTPEAVHAEADKVSKVNDYGAELGKGLHQAAVQHVNDEQITANGHAQGYAFAKSTLADGTKPSDVHDSATNLSSALNASVHSKGYAAGMHKAAEEAEAASAVPSVSAPKPVIGVKAASEVKVGDKVHFTNKAGEAVGTAEHPQEVTDTYTTTSGKSTLLVTKSPLTESETEHMLPAPHVINVHGEGSTLLPPAPYNPDLQTGPHDESATVQSVKPGDQFAGGYKINQKFGQIHQGTPHVSMNITGPGGTSNVLVPKDATINKAIAIHEANITAAAGNPGLHPEPTITVFGYPFSRSDAKKLDASLEAKVGDPFMGSVMQHIHTLGITVDKPVTTNAEWMTAGDGTTASFHAELKKQLAAAAHADAPGATVGADGYYTTPIEKTGPELKVGDQYIAFDSTKHPTQSSNGPYTVTSLSTEDGELTIHTKNANGKTGVLKPVEDVPFFVWGHDSSLDAGADETPTADVQTTVGKVKVGDVVSGTVPGLETPLDHATITHINGSGTSKNVHFTGDKNWGTNNFSFHSDNYLVKHAPATPEPTTMLVNPASPPKGNKTSKVMKKNLKPGDQFIVGPKVYTVTSPKGAAVLAATDSFGNAETWSSMSPTDKFTKINPSHPKFIHPATHTVTGKELKPGDLISGGPWFAGDGIGSEKPLKVTKVEPADSQGDHYVHFDGVSNDGGGAVYIGKDAPVTVHSADAPAPTGGPITVGPLTFTTQQAREIHAKMAADLDGNGTPLTFMGGYLNDHPDLLAQYNASPSALHQWAEGKGYTDKEKAVFDVLSKHIATPEVKPEAPTGGTIKVGHAEFTHADAVKLEQAITDSGKDSKGNPQQYVWHLANSNGITTVSGDKVKTTDYTGVIPDTGHDWDGNFHAALKKALAGEDMSAPTSPEDTRPNVKIGNVELTHKDAVNLKAAIEADLGPTSGNPMTTVAAYSAQAGIHDVHTGQPIQGEQWQTSIPMDLGDNDKNFLVELNKQLGVSPDAPAAPAGTVKVGAVTLTHADAVKLKAIMDADLGPTSGNPMSTVGTYSAVNNITDAVTGHKLDTMEWHKGFPIGSGDTDKQFLDELTKQLGNSTAAPASAPVTKSVSELKPGDVISGTVAGHYGLGINLTDHDGKSTVTKLEPAVMEGYLHKLTFTTPDGGTNYYYTKPGDTVTVHNSTSGGVPVPPSGPTGTKTIADLQPGDVFYGTTSVGGSQLGTDSSPKMFDHVTGPDSDGDYLVHTKEGNSLYFKPTDTVTIHNPSNGATPSASVPLHTGNKQAKVMAKNLKPGDQVLHNGSPYVLTGHHHTVNGTGMFKATDAQGNPSQIGGPGLSIGHTDKLTKINPNHPKYIHAGPTTATPAGTTVKASSSFPTVAPSAEFQAEFQAARKLSNKGYKEKLPGQAIVDEEALKGLSAYAVARARTKLENGDLSDEEAAAAAEEAASRVGKALTPAEQAKWLGVSHGFADMARPVVEDVEDQSGGDVDLGKTPEYAKAKGEAADKVAAGATSRELYAKAQTYEGKTSTADKARFQAWYQAAANLDTAENDKPVVGLMSGHPAMTEDQIAAMVESAKPAANTSHGDLEQWAYNQGRRMGMDAANTVREATAAGEADYTPADLEAAALEHDALALTTVGLLQRKHQGIAKTLHRSAEAWHLGNPALTTGATVDAPKPPVLPNAPGTNAPAGMFVQAGAHQTGWFATEAPVVPFTSKEKSLISSFTGPYRWSSSSDKGEEGSSPSFYSAMNMLMDGQEPTGSEADNARAFVKMCAEKSVPAKHTIYRRTSGSEISSKIPAMEKALAAGESVDLSMPLQSASYGDSVWHGKMWYITEPGALTCDIGQYGVSGEIETVTGGLFEVTKIEHVGGDTKVYLRQKVHYTH